MTESTKIEFRYRQIGRVEDITDLVEMFFPGNRNQQHAAARILLELKHSHRIVPNLAYLEQKHGISRRTLQRTRAKLARLGLIEHVSRLNSRHGGQEGWKLSRRFGSTLRLLADKGQAWQDDLRPDQREKESMLAGLLGR